MYQDTIKELLLRYDELKTRSNQGSWDNWFMVKFRLKRMLDWKPYENFYQRTYTHQFANRRFDKEIQYDLLEYRKLFRSLNVKKGKNEFDVSESLKMLDDYLENMSQTQKKSKWSGLFWKILNCSVLTSVIIPIITSNQQYYPLIVILGVTTMLPLGTWYIADRFSLYVMEKLWYRTCEKELGISKLKSKLISVLIAEINQ